MSAQVGVRTRAQAALAMEAAATSSQSSPKRKKINNEEPQLSNTPPRGTTSSSAVKPVTDERCLSPTSSEIPASCCSSNGSIGHDEDRIKLLDLEVESAPVETSTCNGSEEIERREMNRSSELLQNSQEPESMKNNSHRALSTGKTMPTELELEEFFASAEKDIQKRFQDKYNYDIVKDVPLEGRYEWVQLKP